LSLLEALPDYTLEFIPRIGRARAVDHWVRSHLADSIETILRACESRLVLDREPLAQLIDAIRCRPVHPAVMAIYSDLVEAIFLEDEPAALRLLAELADPQWREASTPHMVALSPDELGVANCERYRRLIDDDPEVSLELVASPPAACAESKERFTVAKDLMARAAPELADEVEHLGRQIVLVDTVPGNGVTIHGASSFYLWGSVMLNQNAHRSRVEIIQGLAHETGHSLLLGLALGAPLVRNPARERYPSPLREDRRPMDGLVHATYVLARMHYAVTGLAASGLLDRSETDQATELAARARANYLEGLAVIDESARFTPLGEKVFDGARRYMTAVLN
jgi:HEXXH motif-containing protein